MVSFKKIRTKVQKFVFLKKSVQKSVQKRIFFLIRTRTDKSVRVGTLDPAYHLSSLAHFLYILRWYVGAHTSLPHKNMGLGEFYSVWTHTISFVVLLLKDV